MAVADVIIARSEPLILTGRIRALLESEAAKGCTNELFPHPTELVPPFTPIGAYAVGETSPRFRVGTTVEYSRFRVWIGKDTVLDWVRSESFLKQLAALHHPLGFEVVGNCDSIEFSILCPHESAPIVRTALRGAFDSCELSWDPKPRIDCISQNIRVSVREFYPAPPYTQLLTTSDEFKHSPFETLVMALQDVDSSELGIYQCLFQSVREDWHSQVEDLLDLEYWLRLTRNQWIAQSYLQQTPSGDLRHAAMELERKAHADKPFFATVVRIGTTAKNPVVLSALSSFMGLFLHGGSPLKCFEYSKSTEATLAMLRGGLVFRPGFLVQSKELVGLVHLIGGKTVSSRDYCVELLEPLSATTGGTSTGTRVGMASYAGKELDVCIPMSVRERGVHITGSSGTGKSTVMSQMVLQDIRAGYGTAFIDPHGDSLTAIASRLSRDDYERCIYFDPSDPDWVPLWNPLKIPDGGDLYRQAGDLLSAFERVSKDWGDRLGYILRNGLIGLSYRSDATLMDLFNLTRQKSEEGERLRKQILDVAVDEPVRKFWELDFLKDYREADLAAPKHKLHKLAASGSVSLMLSQPQGKIDFRTIMDRGQILLVDLSRLGTELKEILGSFVLTLFMLAGFSRDPSQAWKPFGLYADEAHLFVGADAIEKIAAQARKYGLMSCFAHQYLEQLTRQQRDALSTVGATLIGRVNKNDCQYFARDLQDKVKPKDIMSLPPYHMISRIDTEINRVTTLPLGDVINPNALEEIRARSRKHYYDPAQKLQRRSRYELSQDVDTRIDRSEFSAEDLKFDEFR